MKKHFNKTARHSHYHRIGIGIHGLSSPLYSPYYAYPTVVTTMHKMPTADIQQGASLIWAPRLLQDKYSQLMPPTVIKIAADYIGRFIKAI
jgi:hypothetical protein